MNVKAKKKMSKKLIASIVVLVLVSLASIAGIVTVLALTQRNIDSAIFIRFTAIDIDGEVEAAYRVGNADTWTSMGDTHVFKASDEEENAQMNPGNIALTSANNFVEFRYTFRNFGDADYTGLLTLDEVVTENNMEIWYKYNNEEYSKASYGLVVEGVDTASNTQTKDGKRYSEMTYYIKVGVKELSKSASYSSDFFWLLERYDGEVTGDAAGQVIPLATSTYTANGDGTYTAKYNGSNISVAGTSAGSTGISNVWIVPNNIGSAPVTKVERGNDLPANTKVVLGDNVTTIEEGTFSYWDEENGDYFGSAGLAEIVLGNGLTEIPLSAFTYCTNLRSVTIGDRVTSIRHNAFSYCSSLTNIEIPDSVTSIGEGVFASTSLKSVVIPSTVTSIGTATFSGCSSLTNIEIPDSVTSIGEFAFFSCINLTSILIPNNVITIGAYAFSHCLSLKEITIPESVTSLWEYTFHECSELSLEIPRSVENIETEAFEGVFRVKYLVKAAEFSSFDFDMFSGVKNVEIELENGVTEIPHDRFYGFSNLTKMIIPNSVTTIGRYAFDTCSALTSVVIPSSVTSIEPYAFVSCDSLTSAEFKNITNWYVADSAEATNWTNVTISATDFAANATLLISTHYGEYWKRG